MNDKLKELLVALEALRLLEHSLHLNATEYELHLLFQRLYEPLVDEFDKVAEHFVSLGGVVDPRWIAERSVPVLKRWEKCECCECALKAEEDLQILILATVKKSGDNLAVDNTLRGIADNHGTAIYLLRQAVKKSC